ncbi:MAG: PAS domain S-box protein, partial [Blastocatellia bacterium]
MTTSGDIEAIREWTILRSSLLDDLQEAIIITDIDGHVVCWNKSAERLYQWAKPEVLGERMIDFLVSDTEADFVRGIAHAVATGSRWEGIFPARSKDGTPLSSAAVAIPIRDEGGQVASGVMIINYASAGDDEYRRLREVERTDRDTFENSVVGIFQTTGSGQFLNVNATLARMLGYDSPRDFTSNVTSALDIHVEPEKREEFLRMIEEQGSGGILETQLYRKDGQKIWVQVSARAARGEDGDVAFYEGSMQDVTELKLLEEQLKQSQTMEAIGRLAGGVAHDFNNLLTAINGYCQLLVSRLSEGDPCYGYANEILRAANRATALTSDLLTFSRKPAGQTNPIDLNPVVADLAKMLSRVIGEHINISTNLSPALGHLKGDRSQIERVLMNLAVNARDAMPEGGCIAMTTENVRVRASQASRHPGVPPGPYVLLTVADTGVGIDKQTISHIFEPFFTTKGKGKGTGLGLSTA